MGKSLFTLKGLGKESFKKLSKEGCETVYDLVLAASSPESRKTLSKQIGIDEKTLYAWVKQSDLMRVEDIGPADAKLLVDAGLRGIEDLVNVDPGKLEVRIKEYVVAPPDPEYKTPTADILKKWRDVAGTLKSILKYDPSEMPLGIVGESSADGGTSDNVDEFFNDMVDVVVNLGKGIADAQRELDVRAIDMQEKINGDEFLRSAGIMATFYAIPEATFNLKMNYTVVKERSSDASGAKPSKFLISPINARYQNYFKLSQSVQSELNLKFASVPPPPRYSQVIYVPNVIGKTVEEAKTILVDAGFPVGSKKVVEGVPSAGRDTEVKEQTPQAGSEGRFNDKVDLTLVTKAGVVIE